MSLRSRVVVMVSVTRPRAVEDSGSGVAVGRIGGRMVEMTIAAAAVTSAVPQAWRGAASQRRSRSITGSRSWAICADSRSMNSPQNPGGVVKAPTIRVAFFAGRGYYAGSIQPELDPTRPSVSVRTKKLAKGAFAEFVSVQSRPFGLAIRRFDSFLEGGGDVGILVWRSDPVDL